MFNSFALAESESCEQLSRIYALLAGRSLADIALVEHVLSELLVGLECFRKAC